MEYGIILQAQGHYLELFSSSQWHTTKIHLSLLFYGFVGWLWLRSMTSSFWDPGKGAASNPGMLISWPDHEMWQFSQPTFHRPHLVSIGQEGRTKVGVRWQWAQERGTDILHRGHSLPQCMWQSWGRQKDFSHVKHFLCRVFDMAGSTLLLC